MRRQGMLTIFPPPRPTGPAPSHPGAALQKNRVTAARSRERKKEQWAGMSERLNELESENESLRAEAAAMAEENARLKAALARAGGAT